MNNTRQKIIDFIESNGWAKSPSNLLIVFPKDTSEYLSFNKLGHYDIDVGKDEVVLVDETGDFMHLPYKTYTLYTLLGVLLHFKQITMGYNWLKEQE